MSHAISTILHTVLGGTRIAVVVVAGALAGHAGAVEFGVRILPTLGGEQGFASGINAGGWSTGEANDTRGDSLAVLWSSRGTVSVLPTDQLGAGRAINPSTTATMSSVSIAAALSTASFGRAARGSRCVRWRAASRQIWRRSREDREVLFADFQLAMLSNEAAIPPNDQIVDERRPCTVAWPERHAEIVC